MSENINKQYYNVDIWPGREGKFHALCRETAFGAYSDDPEHDICYDMAKFGHPDPRRVKRTIGQPEFSKDRWSVHAGAGNDTTDGA